METVTLSFFHVTEVNYGVYIALARSLFRYLDIDASSNEIEKEVALRDSS